MGGTLIPPRSDRYEQPELLVFTQVSAWFFLSRLAPEFGPLEEKK
jgi:hypothetical protein